MHKKREKKTVTTAKHKNKGIENQLIKQNTLVGEI